MNTTSHVVSRAEWPTQGLRAAVAGVVLCLAACHGKPPPSPPPAIVLAGVVHPESGSGDDPVRYPVEVAARYSTSMSFRVAGKLIERRVRLGDLVRKGETVARLDPVDAQRQAASSQASLEAAQHRLTYTKLQVERDRAQAAQNLIAANQLEQTEDAFAAASAARDQAAAQHTIALNALHYNTLVADHDGVITSENADTGQVVSAGQAIFGLAWSGDTDVNMDAAARDLRRLSVGQAATVAFTALPDRHFDARVREISPAADPQSRTYRVKLTLRSAGNDVRLGMTGDAVLAPSTSGATPAEIEPVFKVPATALFHQGKEPAIWLVRGNDSTLELHAVTVRDYSENFVTVSHGLKDGDRIVLAGVHTVFVGQHVTPTEPLFARESESAK